jgi:hypothetical protein
VLNIFQVSTTNVLNARTCPLKIIYICVYVYIYIHHICKIMYVYTYIHLRINALKQTNAESFKRKLFSSNL